LKNICILGSTGYIGTTAIDILKENPVEYRLIALGAGRNIELFRSQIEELKPRIAAVASSELADKLRASLSNGLDTEIVAGLDGYIEIATLSEVDLVVAAMSGASGLAPIYSAICSGKDIALANKETMVAAGSLLMKESRERNVRIFPIDSEHSAIQQSIQGHNREDLKRIILTGSGGPFKDYTLEMLAGVTPEQALQAYEQRLQEQTAIIFGLVAKMGGKAVLTEADFEASEQFNTILANNNENDDVVLELAFEERS